MPLILGSFILTFFLSLYTFNFTVQFSIVAGLPRYVQVLAGGRIGPAGSAAAAAAAVNGDSHQHSANGSSNGAPMTPTRVTRRTAAAMAAAAADSGSNGSSGQFYPPTVITGVTPDMDLYYEEVFGPVSGAERACWGLPGQADCYYHYYYSAAQHSKEYLYIQEAVGGQTVHCLQGGGGS